MSNIMYLLIHNQSKLNRILTHNVQMWNRVLVIRHLILLTILIIAIVGIASIYTYTVNFRRRKSSYNKNLLSVFITVIIISFLFVALILPAAQGITYPLLYSQNGALVQNSGYLSSDTNPIYNSEDWIRLANESKFMDNISIHNLTKLKQEVKTLKYQKIQDKHYLRHYYRSNTKAQKHYYHNKYQQSRLKYKMIYKGIKPDIRALYFCIYQNKAPIDIL